MKILNANEGTMLIEISNQDKLLIDCLFSMVNAMENPNWGATENGTGGPRLNDETFTKLSKEWRSLFDGDIGRKIYSRT